MQNHLVAKAPMTGTTIIPSDVRPLVDSIAHGSEQCPNVHSHNRPSKLASTALPSPAPPSDSTAAAMRNQEKQLDGSASEGMPSVPLFMQDAPPMESMLVSAPEGQVDDGVDLPDLPPAPSDRAESQQAQEPRGTLPNPVVVHGDLVFNKAKLPEEEPEDHGGAIAVPAAEGYCKHSQLSLPFALLTCCSSCHQTLSSPQTTFKDANRYHYETGVQLSL